MIQLSNTLDPMKTGEDAERLRANLHQQIVGQDEAIEQIVNIYQTYLAGMISPGRPIGNLLFLGPTGSGKTRLVEATAESLAGDVRAMIKVDCAEFQHSHEIAKLIGSPPGYLGHRETHPLLSQEHLNRYRTEKVTLSFVLFDEIEKASDALWNLLLGILDKGTLTLGDNRRVDFSRTMIFMTSNLGASQIDSMLKPALGFAAGEIQRGYDKGLFEESDADSISRAAVEAARRNFTPEFMNRLDKVVVFKPLNRVELRKILGLELSILQQRIFLSSPNAPFVFSLTEAARDSLLLEGTDIKYGARHLKRAIDRALVHPLSNLIATRQVRGGDLIQVDFDYDAKRMTFVKEAEDVPISAMARMMSETLIQPESEGVPGVLAGAARFGTRGQRRRQCFPETVPIDSDGADDRALMPVNGKVI